MFVRAAQYINGIALEFLLEVQALEEGIRFVLTGCEWKHVVDSDNEERDHEGAPKANDESDKATKVRLRVDISVTRSC